MAEEKEKWKRYILSREEYEEWVEWKTMEPMDKMKNKEIGKQKKDSDEIKKSEREKIDRIETNIDTAIGRNREDRREL